MWQNTKFCKRHAIQLILFVIAFLRLMEKKLQLTTFQYVISKRRKSAHFLLQLRVFTNYLQ